MLSKKYLVLAKIETTYGADPTPTAADNAILAKNLDVKPIIEPIDRSDIVLPNLSKIAHLMGRRYAEISFDVELRGTAVTPTAASDLVTNYDPLLKACAFSRTDASASPWFVEYSPCSDNIDSCTIYAWKDGIQHILTGCRGNMNIDGELGKPAVMHFTFRGIYASPTDVTLPTPTFVNLIPPVLLGATFTYDSWAAKVSRFNIDMNNELSEFGDITEDTGISEIFIVDRKPAGGIDPYVVTLSTYDAWTKLEDAHEAILNLVIGSTTGNKATINAPKCVKTGLTYGDRNGVLTYEIGFGLYMSSGDDEVTIKLE